MSTLPTWALYAVGIGSPVSAFIGGMIGPLLLRRGAKELDIRSNREETMRNLRWAAELAVDANDGKARVGLAEIRELAKSGIDDPVLGSLVSAALKAVVTDPVEVLDVAEANHEEVAVIQRSATMSGSSSVSATAGPDPVPLSGDEEAADG